ncbi:MAG: DNA mismatch repair endonuclease MutL [Clostridiales bacterium]|nr:DNA mismatch repair endonuclease MutL [Clostridiales bacterium]
MGRIRMLSESLIGKIAAGEVVERPASALKEMVENSLDAGATAVTAEIRDGGLTYIRVADNGSGIEESDIRMAFERHATSKISLEKDLSSISTLGFRGEALASIAAVSRVQMITRTQSADSGLKVVNEGGKIVSVAETASPVGTTLTVTDLFYNTPVRKGFMKKASVETTAVTDLMTQFILSRPDVSFRYISAGKVLLHSPGDGQLSSALHTIYGSQALKAMRRVEGHANGVVLNGYVGIGENARGNRAHEFFFINGRMMHSPLLSAALETGCRERVMIGKYPVCALHLTIPYEAVDVNVHPNKLEVRFRDEAGVSEAVTSLVVEALRERDAFEKPVEMTLKGGPAPEKAPVTREEIRNGLKKDNTVVTVSRTLPPAAAQFRPAPAPQPVFREIARPPENYVSSVRAADPAPVSAPPADKAPSARKEEKAEQVSTILPQLSRPMKIFGALFNTYILVEYEDHLLMIDQHAVHERLLFDRLMNEKDSVRAGQELLVPIIISLTRKEQELIDQNREVLESIGLNMERFGDRDAAVRTIPMILGEAETPSFIRDIIGGLEEGRSLTEEKKRAMLLQSACKHAVKGGEALTEDQLRGLVEQMIEQKVTPTCPHGRPLVVSVSRRELDRKFKRIQN